jgi:putative intracellular protease/amidase
MEPKNSRTVYLYAFDGMADWEYGFLLAELGRGSLLKGGRGLDIRLVAAKAGPVTTMGGIRASTDIVVDGLRAEDALALILPGGEGWLDPAHSPVIGKARELLENGVVVGAICGATFGLAEAGLLEAIRHTSNDLGYLKAMCPRYRGEALYSQEPAVLHRGLVTASGFAPLEFARAVLEALGLVDPAVLAAWYALNSTKDPAYFWALQDAMTKARIA